MNWISLLGLETLVLRWRAAAMESAMALEDRAELARLEWHDQKRRIGQLLLLGIAVAALTVVAMVLLSLALLVQFWDTPERIFVAWSVAAVWAVGWVVAVLSLMSLVRQAGSGFALTRRELAQDWRAIKERL